MTPFWIALQFLTVLPIELKTMPSAKQNGQAMLFYPLVGLLLGLILFTSAMLLAKLPIILSSALILVLWIWLTGGLHLDGLADTADAWVGGFGDPERTLKIMKDPACGPIGVLSLVVVCLLKFVALYVLLEQQMAVFLIVLPMLGRSVPLFLFPTTPYVRAQGLGCSMTDFMPKKQFWTVFVITMALLCMFKWLGLIALLVFLVMLFYLRSVFIKRIGGITGDTVGAAIELAETSVLLSAVVASFYII
ncbi:adenosylcobinamide-GDP ribazoletransferase [Acinetobacter sp. C26M]|uniref:adenosylcobinamide-GDP ribazoletransferase n=1 Tax=unclassified Acinetobacter TaxID=196816 RepID=UPI002036F0DF|nr:MULTISPECIES: adenosylcobinamide-GDP ribazoletransferase [unclassified Acinetobacter]USA45004.1 adenosylcobinamide-GDP ribazoletransferase [Acinetobacter sp. C26M]USA48507.1 adenosylcobinamide-GDP ribazoletransferase [Acinetobacter sp. C26G]